MKDVNLDSEGPKPNIGQKVLAGLMPRVESATLYHSSLTVTISFREDSHQLGLRSAIIMLAQDIGGSVIQSQVLLPNSKTKVKPRAKSTARSRSTKSQGK